MQITYLKHMQAYSISYQGKILSAGINLIEVINHALQRIKYIKQ